MIPVLIVEDCQETQLILKNVLASVGAKVFMAGTIAAARVLLRTERPALILLDMNLPDGDGFQFCGELVENEESRGIPFIFITGKEEVSTKVAAFAMGAEDYIVKPFNPLELKARLSARIKKITDQKGFTSILKRGSLQIDAAKQRVWISLDAKQETLTLTPREFKILFHLAQNEEIIVSRNQLLDAVWGNDTAVFDRTVDTHISALRKKLRNYSGYIESVSGVGYRFSSAGGTS